MTTEAINSEIANITIEESISGPDMAMFHQLYEEAFGDLRVKAVPRQVLHPAEFEEEMSDPRILKYVSWSPDGHALSLTTLTNELVTVPWISPEYFHAKYPEQAARNAVYYLGFTLVCPAARNTTVFADVVALIIARMANERAILCLDICGFNTSQGFAGVLERMADATAPTSVEVLDTQTFYAASFKEVR